MLQSQISHCLELLAPLADLYMNYDDAQTLHCTSLAKLIEHSLDQSYEHENPALAEANASLVYDIFSACF